MDNLTWDLDAIIGKESINRERELNLFGGETLRKYVSFYRQSWLSVG